jgi:glycosyltransferase involved in cell wall biosynthesis
LNSTYQPLQIIIVNNGSTDDSLQLAQREAAETPLITVIDQESSGVAAVRNSRISNASGEIVLPIDGDDLIHPNYIHRAVSEPQKDPEVKVVYAKPVKFNEKGIKPWKLKKFSRYTLAHDSTIYVSALYRKSDW